MSGFKELRIPEIEEGKSIHTGKWFVFVNDVGVKYANDHENFLHIDGRRMCELKSDRENARIMFDTKLDAFAKSIEFYALHNKAYPWTKEFTELLDKTKGTGSLFDENESQIMRFE